MDILEKLGEANNQIGDFKKAIDYGDQALEMAKQKNDKSKQVHFFYMLSKTCLELEEMEKALDYFENGLDLAQRTKGHPLETELTIKLSELPLSLEISQKPLSISKMVCSRHRKTRKCREKLGY